VQTVLLCEYIALISDISTFG